MSMMGAQTALKNAAMADPAMSNEERANVTPTSAPTPAAAAVQKRAGRHAASNTPKAFAATSLPGARAAVAGNVRVFAAVMLCSASNSRGLIPHTEKLAAILEDNLNAPLAA